MLQSLKTWLDAGLSFLYPEVCKYCGEERATVNEGFIGAACRQTVKAIAPPFCERCGTPFDGEITTPFQCSNCRDMKLYFSRARSAVAATGVVLDAIHRYKYNRALWLEPFLAGLLVRQAAAQISSQEWDMIVPVPLHPSRERDREFNQAERLARRLSQASGIPLQRRALKRILPTPSQTRLSRADRIKNVRRAFALDKERESLRQKRVVLVDDVFTTGATTSACAKVLLRGGAREVCVWAVARACSWTP